MLRYASLRRRLAVLAVAVCVACEPSKAPVKPAAGPQVRATVVTIRTMLQPENRVYMSSVVIAGDHARSMGEHDTWRLYDTKARTVTFVDDVARTMRVKPMQTIVRERRNAISTSLPKHFPRLKLERTGQHRTIQSAAADEHVIAIGGYRRQLWLADHPAIPRGLFAMMHASDPPSTPLAPMAREVDDALIATTGFPLLDHTEVPVGKTKMVVDSSVVNIEQKDVPEALFTIPRNYLDLTPKPKPATK